jgi:hypothetical protein
LDLYEDELREEEGEESFSRQERHLKKISWLAITQVATRKPSGVKKLGIDNRGDADDDNRGDNTLSRTSCSHQF